MWPVCGGEPQVSPGAEEEGSVSSFFERAVPRRDPESVVSGPDEQVSYRLADERVARREMARERAKARKEERP